MKASPQITSAEPRIRIPAWRSASPKKRSAPPPRASRATRAEKAPISPNEPIHSRGTPSQARPISAATTCSRERAEAELGEEEEPDREQDERCGRRYRHRDVDQAPPAPPAPQARTLLTEARAPGRRPRRDRLVSPNRLVAGARPAENPPHPDHRGGDRHQGEQERGDGIRGDAAREPDPPDRHADPEDGASDGDRHREAGRRQPVECRG